MLIKNNLKRKTKKKNTEIQKKYDTKKKIKKKNDSEIQKKYDSKLGIQKRTSPKYKKIRFQIRNTTQIRF